MRSKTCKKTDLSPNCYEDVRINNKKSNDTEIHRNIISELEAQSIFDYKQLLQKNIYSHVQFNITFISVEKFNYKGT